MLLLTAVNSFMDPAGDNTLLPFPYKTLGSVNSLSRWHVKCLHVCTISLGKEAVQSNPKVCTLEDPGGSGVSQGLTEGRLKISA